MNNLLAPYALEALTISNDPYIIAMEASIEDKLGDTKIARKEKRLVRAVQAGDQEKVDEIKKDIDEDVEKLKEAARKAKIEKNLKLAHNIIQIAGAAAGLAGLIVSHRRETATNNYLNDLMERNNGSIPADVAGLMQAQNKDAFVGNTVGRISSATSILSSII